MPWFLPLYSRACTKGLPTSAQFCSNLHSTRSGETCWLLFVRIDLCRFFVFIKDQLTYHYSRKYSLRNLVLKIKCWVFFESGWHDYLPLCRYISSMLVKSTFPCCLSHSVPLHIDLQGMGYLHARGIVHTDLRSKNVFLELNNRVVITDFGLFSVAGLTAKSVRPGWLMIPEGWLPYLAPEILRSLTTQQDAPDSSRFTMATDMYAFGYVISS